MSSTISDVLSSVISTAVPGVDSDWQSMVLWMLIFGFFIAFILAFAVGANDVANSFGTTVGAGTLTLTQACILASFFETIGAVLLGARVGKTIRKGIIDVSIYDNAATLLMAGEISAMLASCLWQLIATFLKLPVSGTHSIVGATVGFSLVARGTNGVNWKKIGLIVGSWFLSPVLAGSLAAAFYFLLRHLIFQKENPVRPGLIALPLMYSATVAINCFSVLFSGSALLYLDKLPTWVDVVISLSIGLLVAALVQLVVVRKLKKSFRSAEDKVSMTSKKVAQAPANKVEKLPPLLEAVSEGDSPGRNVSFEKTVDESGKAGVRFPGNSEDVRKSVTSPDAGSPKTVEEAKLLRQQRSKRSRSTGHVLSSSVRIPALLQLEKNVLKANLPVPSVEEVKEEIRRNFSEPAMAHHADVYEVYINRPKGLVTIQRRTNNESDATRRTQVCKSNERLADANSDTMRRLPGEGRPAGSEQELEKLLSSIEPGMKLEEPFDESDDEGLVMNAPKREEIAPGLYSGAIEEGFRRLTSTNQNIIAIKIGEDEVSVGDVKLSKDQMMEAKEGRFEIRKMFSFLQILTACFGSFAHGGNDVSNAIGPLIAIWIIYSEGGVQQESPTPLWILAYGGFGICVGLWVWGRRVIQTMGNDLTNLTPSRGFTIELMSAITVLMASNVGLPVSTTHCKVGAVVAVGWVRSRQAVDWKIFRNIVLAWFVTVPVSGSLSALVFAIIRSAASL